MAYVLSNLEFKNETNFKRLFHEQRERLGVDSICIQWAESDTINKGMLYVFEDKMQPLESLQKSQRRDENKTIFE